MGMTNMKKLKYLDIILKEWGLSMIGCDNEEDDFIRHNGTGEVVLYMSDLSIDEVIYRTEQWVRDAKINKIIQ